MKQTITLLAQIALIIALGILYLILAALAIFGSPIPRDNHLQPARPVVWYARR